MTGIFSLLLADTRKQAYLLTKLFPKALCIFTLFTLLFLCAFFNIFIYISIGFLHPISLGPYEYFLSRFSISTTDYSRSGQNARTFQVDIIIIMKAKNKL